MSLFLTIIKALLLVFISIAALQIGAVYLLRFMQPELVHADLVAIMPSTKDRIAYGCMVASDPGAAHLMLINNSPAALAKHATKHGVPDSVTLLPGGKSRSSFEDIYITVQTARDRNLKSVILVTSDYHLPRALFLLYVYSKAVGSELHVQYLPSQRKMNFTTRVKLLYNEVLKFWGSTVELGSCLIIAQLPLDSEKFLNVRNVLKNILLFRV